MSAKAAAKTDATTVRETTILARSPALPARRPYNDFTIAALLDRTSESTVDRPAANTAASPTPANDTGRTAALTPRNNAALLRASAGGTTGPVPGSNSDCA